MTIDGELREYKEEEESGIICVEMAKDSNFTLDSGKNNAKTFQKVLASLLLLGPWIEQLHVYLLQHLPIQHHSQLAFIRHFHGVLARNIYIKRYSEYYGDSA